MNRLALVGISTLIGLIVSGVFITKYPESTLPEEMRVFMATVIYVVVSLQAYIFIKEFTREDK